MKKHEKKRILIKAKRFGIWRGQSFKQYDKDVDEMFERLTLEKIERFIIKSRIDKVACNCVDFVHDLLDATFKSMGQVKHEVVLLNSDTLPSEYDWFREGVETLPEVIRKGGYRIFNNDEVRFDDCTVSISVEGYYQCINYCRIFVEAIESKIELQEKLKAQAKEKGFTLHGAYHDLISSRYVSIDSLKAFEKYINQKIVLEKRKKSRRISKKRKKLLGQIESLNLCQDPIAKEFINNIHCNESQLEAFEEWIQEIMKDERANKEHQQRQEQRELRKKKIRFVLNAAIEIGYTDTRIQALSQGDELSDKELDDLDCLLKVRLKKNVEIDTAEQQVPKLMEDAEKMFEDLSPIEQADFRKKMNEYRKAFENKKDPRKLKRNLEWLIKKLSNKK